MTLIQKKNLMLPGLTWNYKLKSLNKKIFDKLHLLFEIELFKSY